MMFEAPKAVGMGDAGKNHSWGSRLGDRSVARWYGRVRLPASLLVLVVLTLFGAGSALAEGTSDAGAFSDAASDAGWAAHPEREAESPRDASVGSDAASPKADDDGVAPASSALASDSGPLRALHQDGGAPLPIVESPPPDNQLTAVVVTAHQVKPTDVLPARPAESVYGTEAPILDTPRSISQVNASQVANDGIRTADDLVKYAPGVTRGGGQNVNIAPQIRGQNSELFQDGQRGYNVRHPTNLNAYEGADLVAGQSSVVFGPASASGGYINYLSKKPNFDKANTEVSSLFGSLVPGGGSYGGARFTVDTNQPLSDKLAYRLSITLQRSNDYYDNVRNNYNAFYGAVAWEPHADVRVEWNASYDDYYDFNITHGWNRITQQLVDSYGKQYAAGRATPIINSPGAGLWSPVFGPGSSVVGWQKRQRNDAGQYVAVGPVNEGALPNATPGSAGSIQGWVYDPNAPGNGLAQISPAQFSREEDQNTARRLTTQGRVTWALSPEIKLVNRFFYERSRDTTNSVGSFLSQSADHITDNRLELHTKNAYNPFGRTFEHQSNSGVGFRTESFTSLAANNSFNINPYDLTQNPSNKTPGGLLGLPTSGASGSWVGQAGVPQLSPYFGYLNLPAMYPTGNGLYAERGGTAPRASYTSVGQWTTWTLFTQHNFLFDRRYGVNAGFSQSYIHAEIANPLVVVPADNYGDQDSYRLNSVQVSPFFKPTEETTVYFTYDRSLALNTGGFANVLTWGANNKLNPLSFNSLSELYEGGAKANIIPDRLFASAAAFYQARDTAPDTNGNMARLIIKGVEAAIRLQPERHVRAGVNLSYLTARYTSIIPAGFSPFGFYADNATVWGDSNRLNQRVAGEYEAAGIPHYSANAYVNYRLDNGLGAELSGWWTSGWYTNLSKSVRVPGEYNTDLRVYYERPQWDVSILFLNLTDQKNFVNGLAGSTTEFLQPTRPLSIQGKLAFRF